jgi:hypothetical protein
MNTGNVRLILTKDLRNICAKIVATNFSSYKNMMETEFCSGLSAILLEKTGGVGEIVNNDKTRVFQYNPEAEQQSLK